MSVASLVNGESLKTPFGSGKLLSIREASIDLPECAVVQLSFGTAYLSLSSLGVISKTVTAKSEGGGEAVEKKEGDNDNEDDDDDENEGKDDDDDEDEEEEEETTPSKSKSSNRFGSKVAAARTKKMQKARENFQRRAEAAAAAAGGSGSNFIVELEEGDEDGENGDEDDVENASKVVKTPKASSVKSPSSGLSQRTPASQQARSPTLLPATTAGKGTPSASNAPMTDAKRALAEAKRAELLLRSPVMQKQPRELTEAQKLALASKGVLKELVAENDLGSGAGGSGGGTGVLEAIAAVEVGEGLGGLLSTAAAITVVGVCVGGLYMMMRRR